MVLRLHYIAERFSAGEHGERAVRGAPSISCRIFGATGPAPPPPDTTQGAAAGASSETPSRVRIQWVSGSPDYIVHFPTSINECGDRVAAIISSSGNIESFFPEWIEIKNVKTDESERTIQIVGFDLMNKLERYCSKGPSTCPYMDQLKKRVAAANAALAEDRWRPFPCAVGIMKSKPDDPECEPFFETEVEFKNHRLIISRQNRVLLNVRKPTWAYRDRSPGCRATERTEIQSAAFDPKTGIFVVGLEFWAMVEGCDEPLWDFHPIRLPALRKKPARGRDAGAP